MKIKILPVTLLLLYCALLIKIMVFKDLPTINIGGLMLNFSGTNPGHTPNFIPFTTIYPYLLGHKGLIIASINLLGNIGLLIPIGILAPLVFKDFSTQKSLLLGFCSGLSIEVMQVILQVGIFDIDDIILNALGVMIGYWTYAIYLFWWQKKQYTLMIVASLLVLIISFGGFYTFFPKGNASSQLQPKKLAQNEDLCGGTGGTGEIIKTGVNRFTIKRNDGVIQQIRLTNQTIVKTSSGPIAASALKVGERVTIVIDETETASMVLVCALAHSNIKK